MTAGIIDFSALTPHDQWLVRIINYLSYKRYPCQVVQWLVSWNSNLEVCGSSTKQSEHLVCWGLNNCDNHYYRNMIVLVYITVNCVTIGNQRWLPIVIRFSEFTVITRYVCEFSVSNMHPMTLGWILKTGLKSVAWQ